MEKIQKKQMKTEATEWKIVKFEKKEKGHQVSVNAISVLHWTYISYFYLIASENLNYLVFK